MPLPKSALRGVTVLFTVTMLTHAYPLFAAVTSGSDAGIGAPPSELAGTAPVFPGPAQDFHGYVSHKFTVDGCSVCVVQPRTPLPGRPICANLFLKPSFLLNNFIEICGFIRENL